MDMENNEKEPPELVQRKTLCLSTPGPGVILHEGDEHFGEELRRYYAAPENNAAEKLVELKAKLKDADTESFWELLMEGMSDITGSQYAFVAKRILFDDEHSAIEMPPIGEPGSCLMGLAFYINDGHGMKDLYRNYKYMAYGAPCGYMRHDKVFIIPEKFNDFIVENPNKLPIPCEAYLGIPLVSEGKCFAHFGALWSLEGAQKRTLGWGYIEMLLHSLEDLILDRVLSGRSFTKCPKTPLSTRVIPQEAISATQSLKPYARSLSHELRTPMQGVVGMLDVMHATVKEAVEGQSHGHVRKVFQALKEDIEVVQDSSRRAVEAADNVVRAYDLNMEIPDTPIVSMDDEAGEALTAVATKEKRPSILVEGNNIPVTLQGTKRRRAESFSLGTGSATKQRVIGAADVSSRPRTASPSNQSLKMAVREIQGVISGLPATRPEEDETSNPSVSVPAKIDSPEITLDLDSSSSTSLRHTTFRELLHYIINEALRVGGRPESAIAEDTDLGETIEVRTKAPAGSLRMKRIEWSVDPSIPETLYNEPILTKVISSVFLNALKFTERGRITLDATRSPKSRYVVINIRDTGSGIPEAFLPNLFKPFSREDDSLTRKKEGLGLGLLVAKGLVRKIGGDLLCVRSETSGPNKGSDFEIRVPINPPEDTSRSSTPLRTPTPSSCPSRTSPNADYTPLRNFLQPSSRSNTVDDLLSQTDYIKDGQSRATAIIQPTPGRFASSPGPQDHSISDSASRKHTSSKPIEHNKKLAEKYPMTFLVAEDNKINRRILVHMLKKLGYTDIHEAYDGAEAVRQMEIDRHEGGRIDVVLMDLWMPSMDGYEATERILHMEKHAQNPPTVLAVSADVTGEALERAARVGMNGFMTKPYKLMDLERLILEYCSWRTTGLEA
ncbi:MAG: hypothetical protein M1819_002241 [Sarea resinae]|nr:MAG: hypothetical protein M1819_002241 [Sarea resinae]